VVISAIFRLLGFSRSVTRDAAQVETVLLQAARDSMPGRSDRNREKSARHRAKHGTMFHRPKGGARVGCLGTKRAVRAVIAREWFH